MFFLSSPSTLFPLTRLWEIQNTRVSLKYPIPVRWLFNVSFLSCVCGEGVRVGVDAGTDAHVCTAHAYVRAYTCMELCVEARDWHLVSCLSPSPLLFLIQSLSLSLGLTSSSGQQALGIFLPRPLQHWHYKHMLLCPALKNKVKEPKLRSSYLHGNYLTD